MNSTFGADKRKNMPPCKSLTLFTNCVVRSKVQDRLVCQSAHTACGSSTPQATLSQAGTSKPCDTRRRVRSQANAYSTVNSTVLGQESCPSALQVRSAHIHTHIHTHETRGKAIRHVQCSRSENASKCTRSARTKNAAVENANKGGLECIKMQQILECRTN